MSIKTPRGRGVARPGSGVGQRGLLCGSTADVSAGYCTQRRTRRDEWLGDGEIEEESQTKGTKQVRIKDRFEACRGQCGDNRTNAEEEDGRQSGEGAGRQEVCERVSGRQPFRQEEA